MDTASKILLSVLIISIIVLASFYTYYLNSTNLTKIFETLFSENTSNNVNVYRWYHDVYVYIPQRNNTEQPIVFKGQANASVYIFGYNANREWTVLAYGESNAEAFGNGTYYAHIEYDLYLPQGAYATPILVLAGITFREIEYKGNKIENVTRWAALYYQVFVNPEGYLYVYNITREEYFNKINKIENQYLRQNLDDIISKVALPYCLDVTDPELELICSIIDEEARAIRDYLNRYNLTFYIDEHTVKVYLNYHMLNQHFVKIRGENYTEQSTLNPQSTKASCENPWWLPFEPLECVKLIHERYINVPVHLFAYYGIHLGNAYSVAQISYKMRSLFEVSGSVGMTATFKDGGYVIVAGYSFGTTKVWEHSSGAKGTFYYDETIGILNVVQLHYKIWRIYFKRLCFLLPGCSWDYHVVYSHEATPTGYNYFTEYAPSLPSGWNHCTSCIYTFGYGAPYHIFYNTTTPRERTIYISNFISASNREEVKFSVGATVVNANIRITLYTANFEKMGLAREIIINAKFYDDQNTKDIRKIYLCGVPHYNIKGIAVPWSATSWCVCSPFGDFG